MKTAASDPVVTVDGDWSRVGSNRARWRANGVLHVVLGDERHVQGDLYEERDGRDALALVGVLIGERASVTNLTDIRRIRRTTAAVRRLPSHPSTKRLALLVGGPISRMLGNAYMGIVKLPHATRLFTDEEKAVAWLLSGGAPESDSGSRL